jgi:hypothetical protein
VTDKPPAPLHPAADVQRMLRDLGHDGEPNARDALQERAREARMAARIDAEVASLVRARGRRHMLFGVAAAAALVAAALGLRHGRVNAGSLGISPEPVAASSSLRKPRQVEPPPAPATVPRAVVSAVRRSNGVPSVAPAPASAPEPSSAEPTSTLGEENQLFKEAAEAGRNGDVGGALARLDKLLVEHPASPLAQTAIVRKFRLLAKAGRGDEARREAERYVSAYPSGFAVSEAQALIAGSSGANAP